MKRLLFFISVFTSLTLFADNNSCLDSTTITGLSDNAVLEIGLDKFQQGYLEDIDSSIELRLDTTLQGYDMVMDFTEKQGQRLVSKVNMSGIGDRINRIEFPYNGANKMELESISVGSQILLSHLHRYLDDLPNPKYAELKLGLSEYDHLTPNESIGKISLSMETLRREVMQYNGKVNFFMRLKKGRTVAIVTLKVKCNH